MPTVLITGASRGLGWEFARQYSREGWRVIGTVRRAEAAERLRRLGDGVQAHLADVAKIQNVKALATAFQGVPIDLLICNAGVRGRMDLSVGSLDYAEWEEILRVNVLGAAAAAEALAPNVAAGKQKIIVMVSSRLGSITESRGSEIAYATSKTALNAVMRAFALQLRSKGITVVSLSPGWVRTDMGGNQAPLSAGDSVAALKNLIASLTLVNSGRFYSFEGQEIPF